MKLKLAVIKNIIAGTGNQAINVICRLIQVPLLLSVLGTSEYGRWIVLSSIPSILSMSNIGFGSVAANDISISIAANNIKKAKEIYSTTLIIIIGIVVNIFLISLIASNFINFSGFLGVSNTREREIQYAFIFLALNVLINFPNEVFSSRFRAARMANVSIAISGFRPLVDLIAISFVVRFSTTFDDLSLALLTTSVIYLFFIQQWSRKVMPCLSFSFKFVKFENFYSLFTKGLSFQLFTLGNILQLQGTIFVIQFILGPTYVALYSSIRTLTGIVNQALGMINQATWPEFTHLLGKSDYGRAARLHRIGSLICYLLAFFGFFLLAILGQYIYNIWTLKNLNLPFHLLIVFLLPIPISAASACSHSVIAACNQHEQLAVRFLAGTVLSLLSAIVLSPYFGMEGVALSSLFIYLFTTRYAINYAIILTHDTFPGFFNGIKMEFFYFFKMFLKKFLYH